MEACPWCVHPASWQESTWVRAAALDASAVAETAGLAKRWMHRTNRAVVAVGASIAVRNIQHALNRYKSASIAWDWPGTGPVAVVSRRANLALHTLRRACSFGVLACRTVCALGLPNVVVEPSRRTSPASVQASSALHSIVSPSWTQNSPIQVHRIVRIPAVRHPRAVGAHRARPAGFPGVVQRVWQPICASWATLGRVASQGFCEAVCHTQCALTRLAMAAKHCCKQDQQKWPCHRGAHIELHWPHGAAGRGIKEQGRGSPAPSARRRDSLALFLALQ